MHLTLWDDLLIAIYFFFVVGVGLFIKRQIKTSDDFLLSGRSVPLWITSLAFISANLGAQEVIGMCASGAKYGIMTAHFYWVGAIPAMVFLGIFMMPFYYGSRARSVPEYLAMRFDEKTRAFNAFSFVAMTLFSSGISLYALAMLTKTVLGWSMETSIFLSAGIVTTYTFLGGLTSAVYNEVIQFFLIIFGISPIVVLGLIHLGGWQGMVEHLPEAMTHLWRHTATSADNAMGVSWLGIVFGLGFVLSYGYWCTDFLVVQRAMIARNISDAQKTPILAALPKILMPLVVILPGLIALALQNQGQDFHIPLKGDGRVDYDMAFVALMSSHYPAGLLGVGLTALLASFMSGMAGNVTAFNSVWTYDIYQAYIRKNASDAHYFWVGKAATVAGVLLSIGTAYLAMSFNNIMDFLQLVFGFVNAPLFATFFLGMAWRRATGDGAFWGLISGTLAAAVTHGLTVAEGKGGWLTGSPVYWFHSNMSQAFAIAVVAWSACFLVTIAVSLLTRPKPPESLRGLVYGLTDRPHTDGRGWWTRPLPLGILVLTGTIVLNLYFW